MNVPQVTDILCNLLTVSLNNNEVTERTFSPMFNEFCYVNPSIKPSNFYTSSYNREGGGCKTTPRNVSASKPAKNEIMAAIRMLTGSNSSTVRSVTPSDVTGSQKSKMALKTYVSRCTQKKAMTFQRQYLVFEIG